MFTSNFSEQKGDLAIYYEMSEGERTETRGIVEVCPKTSRWKEKSLKDITVRIREILLVQITVPNPWIVLPWPLKPVATPYRLSRHWGTCTCSYTSRLVLSVMCASCVRSDWLALTKHALTGADGGSCERRLELALCCRCGSKKAWERGFSQTPWICNRLSSL